MSRFTVAGLAFLIQMGLAFGQEAETVESEKKPWILSVYLSTWINRCDVPAASQFSKWTPALGPTFALSKGRWRVSTSAYLGEYDFDVSGFTVLSGPGNPRFESLAPGNSRIEFDRESARERGFSVEGSTKREDLSFGVGYRLSNAFQVGLSLEYNHRDSKYQPVLPVAADPALLPASTLQYYDTVAIEGDPEGRVVLLGTGGYNIHQFWFGPQFHGFTPLTGRIGGFYNASFLMLAYENRRAPVYHNDDGEFIPPGANGSLQLEPRGFAGNFGTAFSLGVSYSLNPKVGVWGGYSLKFLTEANTELLDNSMYQGPYFGIGYTFF